MVYLYDGVPYSNTNEQIAISSNTDVLHNTMLSEKKEKTYRDFVHIKFKNREVTWFGGRRASKMAL